MMRRQSGPLIHPPFRPRASEGFFVAPTIYVLAGIHFVVDSYGNIYAPLLPLLLPHLGMSLAVAGTLTMVYQMAASMSQLGFGHLADRWRPRLQLVAGPVLGVVVLSLIGLPRTVWQLGLVLVVGGLGGAAFHPPGAALVGRLGGERRGMAMALHIAAGSAGVAFGPLLAAPLIGHLGLAWTPVLAIPGCIAVAPLLMRVPPIVVERNEAAHEGIAVLKPYARPLSRLYVIVALRTLVWLSFLTFLPVLLTERGESVSLAGVTIAIFLASACVGGLIGGAMADRFGPRTVILTTLLGAVPLLTALPLAGHWELLPMLFLGGMLLQATLPVTVTFAQTIAPVRTATVSSLMMGFGWGLGALLVPLVGVLGDRIGIAPTLAVVAGVLPLAALFALGLPRGVLPSVPRGQVWYDR